MAKKLFYSDADADTLAASDFVGSYVYGTLKVTSTTDGLKEGLDVNLINDIMVDLNGVYDVSTNPLPDNVGTIFHTRDAAPDETMQVVRTTAAAAASDAVVDTEVFGVDVNGFNMVYNGTTWDRLTGTAGAINIADGGNSITVDAVNLDIRDLSSATDSVTAVQGTSPWVVSDAALANTAVLATQKSVTTTSGALLASQLAARKYLWLYHNGTKIVDVGQSGVAAGSGFPIMPGVYFEMRLGPAVSLHADAVSGTQDIRLLEAS